ncbi:RNA-directed DNA polymerase, eukaryota [Tanacetum coccineum]
MGELWVMMEFVTEESIKLFRDNVSVGSWFSQIKQASMDFVTEGRIAWVEIEGIPFKLWSGNTFKRIAAKWGELLDVDDQEEMCFHSKRLCIHTKSGRNILEEFKIIYRGKVFWIRANETPGWVPNFVDESEDEDQNDDDFKDGGSNVHEMGSCGGDSDVEEVPDTLFEKDGQYPPGFTPNEGTDAASMHMEGGRNDNVENLNDCNMEEANVIFSGNRSTMNSKDDGADSVRSGLFKKSKIPRTGGSILSLLDELVKVGQVMGYNMDGCLAQKAKKDWVKELCVRNKVNFLALQETKMENMDLICVKTCWGNLAFDYVHSDSVGNSGGILCVWDPNFFCKSNATISDYFVMVRGVWRLTGQDLLMIAVYAPHDFKDKQLLWDYLTREIGANMFNSFITNAGLVEVSLGGSSFTWCHKSATKMSKLDRFLVSKSLLSTWPNITAVTLERYLSDHRPILLRESHFDYGPTPFRFFHYWFEMEGFSKIVEDAWRECPRDESNAMINMMGKLKYLKTKIREWNKTNMLCVKNVKAKYKVDLEDVEAIIDNGNGNEEVVNKRAEIVNNLQSIDKLHSLETAQKVKVKWSVEGDENSSFFHGMLNKKRNLLNIRGIMIDGIWIDNPNRVKREFFNHFSKRFCKPDPRRALIQMKYQKCLSSEQRTELESEVTNDEIKRAVWDCGTDKAPGPDGFTFGFYRRFWYIIESDVYDAVKHFFTYEDIPKGCNSSFIALIPKIPGANLVKDFRPISLIGSLYKIIAKILANRLVGVLGDIVNEVQSAFIADRQILDGPFILNEVLQWCKVKKKQSLIFKVDFEKAYDSVRWDFLDDVLSKFGFGEKWRKWIQCCLRSSRGSIIINGSPTEEFQFCKGLKQGDPLSPFLFILIMESLHLSFQRVVDAGMFKGIKLGASVNISHMFYADDAVFVGQWCESNISTLVHVLECFYRASGLRINMSKSKIMGVYVDSDKVKRAALGCLILKPPFFISRKKASWVNWKKVLAPKERGGLGCIQGLYALNRGLMFKWVWRFYTQDSSLWARVIKAIHEDDGKMGVITRAGSKSCWMNIVHETNALLNKDFSVASVRKLIDDKSIPVVDYKTRWIKYVPIKVNVHAWKVKSDSLPTRFNISRRGIYIDSIMCAICDKGAETSSHLFFSCCMVRQAVRLITCWWDVPYMEFESYDGWLAWLVNLRLPYKN